MICGTMRGKLNGRSRIPVRFISQPQISDMKSLDQDLHHWYNPYIDPEDWN